MADQNPERNLRTRNPAEVAQNRATGTSADNSDRDQTGDDDLKEGRLKQKRTVQGGGGGSTGGGGGKKDS